jgi:hypothetical protein
MSGKPDQFESALKAEGVTGVLADLARSIYQQESGSGSNTKTSNRGAVGGMQVLAGTFGEMADKGWSIDNPEHNARAGIRYLKKLDKLSGGVPELTAAGYYGGPGGLEKARRGIAVSDPMNPNAPNTLQYGQQVVARLGRMPAQTVAQQEAAQVAPVPVETPPQILAQAAEAPAPMPAFGPDPWQAFLQTMPQNRQPVNVADLDFANPQPAMQMPRFQYQPVENRRPNFEAFSSWKGRVA